MSCWPFPFNTIPKRALLRVPLSVRTVRPGLGRATDETLFQRLALLNLLLKLCQTRISLSEPSARPTEPCQLAKSERTIQKVWWVTYFAGMIWGCHDYRSLIGCGGGCALKPAGAPLPSPATRGGCCRAGSVASPEGVP